MDVQVPDLGDFSDVEVIELFVKPGDVVAVEDPLITLETDKAAMDVPSPAAGRVQAVKVTVGDRVSAGDTIVELEPSAAATAEAEAEARPDAEAAAARPAAAVAEPAAPPAPPAPSRPAATINEAGFARAHASPSVRKLARELGVDLARVAGSGRKGRVTAADVKAFVKQTMLGAAPGAAALPAVPEVDFAKFGPVEMQPLSRIRRISGPRLHASWVNIPHVTQHDEADITALEETRQALKAEAAERGIRLTPLAFVLRACVLALTEFPRFKSSLSADGNSIVAKRYTHVGFAADTEQGLVVPVIRDADQKDVFELAASLAALSERARDGRLKPDDLQGGVFTVSSLGGIGGRFFTPIINAPEVAILGVSRHFVKPVWSGQAFEPRLTLPLSLAYDHRVIDGAEAVRFTTRLAEILADIDRLVEAVP